MILYILCGFGIVVCWLLSILFSGSETGFLSLNKMKLRSLVEAKSKRALIVSRLLKSPDRFLAGILVGNNITIVTASSLATFAFVAAFGKIGTTIATIMTTVVVVLFCEIIPKALFRQYPDTLAYKSAGLLDFFLKILSPIAKVFTAITRLFSRLLDIQVKKSKSPFVTREEVTMLVRESEKEGVIETHERDMIHSIFEFKDTKAGEVMVPLTDVVAASTDATLTDIKELSNKHGFTRIPIYKDRIDNIIGIVNIFDVLYNLKSKKWQTLIRDIHYVPTSKSCHSLIRVLQKKHEMMAVVVNEYGSSIGLVTIEDLMEEIVGEIYDETDTPVERIKKLGDNNFLIDGRTEIVLLNKKMDLSIPEGDYETISGYIFDKIGRIPVEGEKIREKGF
ncbi:hypothetical protein COT47_05510, partial [Candidatus Woesearchaeota archaeon CG08_land_8_20_14_0_20_43_7]